MPVFAAIASIACAPVAAARSRRVVEQLVGAAEGRDERSRADRVGGGNGGGGGGTDNGGGNDDPDNPGHGGGGNGNGH